MSTAVGSARMVSSGLGYKGGMVEYDSELAIPKSYSAAPMNFAMAPSLLETVGPVTYAAAPPLVETLEVVRGPGGQQQVREVISQPPVVYAAAPRTVSYPGQRVDALEVLRSTGGVQEIVEVLRDDAEIFALRMELEEKSILVAEYQRRNAELQASKADLERRMGDTNGQIEQLRAERSQLQKIIEENQDTISQQQAEIELLLARNEELSATSAEQAQRIADLDNLVLDLELKNSQQLTEINALRKCNQELEQLVAQQAAKIAELESLKEELKLSRPQVPETAPAPVHDNLSDEDLIDQRIKEFFRNHTDYQVSLTKERVGLYTFAKPISKKVNMKVVGREVLARVGGGWEEVWSWLGSERVKFLEAEGILDKDNSATKKGRTSRALGNRGAVQRQNGSR